MHRPSSSSFMILLLLCGLGGTALAQSQSGESLGDIAREHKAQQQAQEASGNAPKVITNQDLPAGSRPAPQADTSDTMTMVSGVTRPERFSEQTPGMRPPAARNMSADWRARIAEQENRIAELQARIDRVNASVHSAGTASETPTNRYQAMQMQHLSMMQEILSQQKQRLAMMEDAARHSGMNQ